VHVRPGPRDAPPSALRLPSPSGSIRGSPARRAALNEPSAKSPAVEQGARAGPRTRLRGFRSALSRPARLEVWGARGHGFSAAQLDRSAFILRVTRSVDPRPQSLSSLEPFDTGHQHPRASRNVLLDAHDARGHLPPIRPLAVRRYAQAIRPAEPKGFQFLEGKQAL
jgi:hypothetical protein